MCGIAGWIAPSDRAPPPAVLEAMLERIAHRGPDGDGRRHLRADASGHAVALGHRRLAIVDPQGSAQPLVDDEAGLTLVFNGEIYNYRALRTELTEAGHTFERDSDTEVLLHAYRHWGRGLLHRLRGMFAFALWDARAQQLLLARDRFGEKPLFLHHGERGLYFASEIKALLALPGLDANLDLEAVWDYFAYRYVPGPRTLFDRIWKLPPGTFVTWRSAALRQWRYWTADDARPLARTAPVGDPAAEFLARLDESVRLQMATSHVPYGAFLSGGLDSSTVVALMSRHDTRVRTYSVGFSEAGYSELEPARRVARRFGTEHHELVADADDLMRALPSLVAARDAPVSEPSDIPLHLLAREAARDVKMVLTGEGSDEVLGGYPKHLVERFAPCLRHLPRALLRPLADALPYGWRRSRTAMACLAIADWRERYVRWFGALDHGERARLSSLRFAPGLAVGAPPFDADPRTSPLRRMLYFDQTSWLPDNLLERADRMAMAASLETRAPFLDHQLTAFVSSLPDRYRVRGWSGKWILRTAARRLLPADILARPKVGFRVPVHAWLRGPMRDFVLDHLAGPASRSRGFYDARALDTLVAEHLDGRRNHEKLLWSLLNLEIWVRRYA